MAEQARLALAQRRAQGGRTRRMATSSASRPTGPRRSTRCAIGRLVLDGDVILPADGATINERRKIAVNGLIAVTLCRSTPTAAWPARRWCAPFGVPVEDDRDDFIADATDAAARAFEPGADEDKVARGGAARGAPLRDPVDRQEADGRRGVRPGRAMKIGSIIAIYFLFFAASAFILLPFGVRTDEEAGDAQGARPGRQRAAPLRPQAPFAQGGAARRDPVRALLRQLDLSAGSRPTISTSTIKPDQRWRVDRPGPARRRACPCRTTSGSPPSSRRRARRARGGASPRNRGRSG